MFKIFKEKRESITSKINYGTKVTKMNSEVKKDNL